MSGRLVFFSAVIALTVVLLFGIFQLSKLAFVVGGFLISADSSNSFEGKKYDRSAFGSWSDLDGDCLNTRDELLIIKSIVSVTLDESGCNILSGKWVDVYSGNILLDTKNIDVDHLVPLSLAWKLGASNWTDQERTRFYNDEDNIILTGSSVNRKKGDSSPLEWMPEEETFQCEYVSQFLQVLSEYSLFLSNDISERLDQLHSVSCVQEG